jgi:hypothetical protein
MTVAGMGRPSSFFLFWIAFVVMLFRYPKASFSLRLSQYTKKSSKILSKSLDDELIFQDAQKQMIIQSLSMIEKR